MLGRRLAGGVGVALMVSGFVWGLTGLHGFGTAITRYGNIVAHAAVPDRAATNSIAVTTFDYRGFDTLGEEFILFASVIGVAILLRNVRSEEDVSETEVEAPGPRGSEASRWLGTALVGPVVVLGGYIVTHGHLTPGGGFQGGVILAAAVAVAFVGGQYVVLLSLRRSATWMEVSDAIGAAGFAVLGFAGLILAGSFFGNFLPKGTSGLLTGGFIPLANVAVGLEVAGAMLLVLAELLDQRLLSTRT